MGPEMLTIFVSYVVNAQADCVTDTFAFAQEAKRVNHLFIAS
jgi:hypothetical protein